MLIGSSCGASSTQGRNDQSHNIPHMQGPFQSSHAGDQQATQGHTAGLPLEPVCSGCDASPVQGPDHSCEIPQMQTINSSLVGDLR